MFKKIIKKKISVFSSAKKAVGLIKLNIVKTIRAV